MSDLLLPLLLLLLQCDVRMLLLLLHGRLLLHHLLLWLQCRLQGEWLLRRLLREGGPIDPSARRHLRGIRVEAGHGGLWKREETNTRVSPLSPLPVCFVFPSAAAVVWLSVCPVALGCR
jgi:hypothetical protein